MNFSKANKLFNGHGIFEQQSCNDNHSFACYNKKMEDINLSIFSLSTLKKWIAYKPNQDQLESLVSRNINSEFELEQAVKDIIENDYDDGDKANISVWRNEGRNGQYINFEFLYEWTYESFSWHDLHDVSGFSESITALGTTEYLIKLNDYIQTKLILYPEPSLEKNWHKTEIAAYEFFIDVNSSRERCLSWTKKFSFLKESLKETDTGSTTVSKEYDEEEVNIKLYFFSNSNTRKALRKVGNKELNIVCPKKNAAGQEYISKNTGKIYYATDKQNPRSHTGASLDIKYNEFLNKWESGTPQAVAIMTTDLPAVQKPDLQDFIGGEPSSILHHETGLEVLQGSAIPLSMDQCNPLQWCPSYSQDQRTRDKATEDEVDHKKLELKVYNISDTTSFSSGDIVILNRIDGVWIPIPYASGGPIESKPTTSLGKWDFTYLMTNSDYYFRNIDDELLSFDSFEKGLHKAYYTGDGVNENTYSSADTKFANVTNDYFQVTSWDFMGGTIGGLRTNGHAIACTQFEFHPDGTRVGDSDNGRDQQRISGPFFGCVFPNGYQEDQTIDTLKSTTKDFNIKPTGAKDKDNRQHEFFIEIPNSQDVFENKNTNIEDPDPSKGGMFAHGNISQLPADIAMNASPEGTFGRPISLVRTLPTGITSVQNQFKEYFENEESGVPKRYSWLYKSPVSSELTDSDVNNSAFDIRPVNIRKIQFRPLKTETYACFELDNLSDYDEFAFIIPGKIGQTRGEFASQMWKTQTVDENPIATGCLTRNMIGGNDLYHGKGVGLIYENSIDHARPESNNNPDFKWERQWVKYGDGKTDNIGGFATGNAFGVIGAVCTATFSTKIEFVLDNYIGMNAWFGPGGLYPSWGRGSYNTNHTTQLWVRCFHSWPREQTVYDSRFFAVHHFNEGIDKQEYANETLDAEDQAEVDASGQIFSVDFLEISSPSLGQKVYSNTEVASGVATRRRGKLLPYKWQYNTLGVGPFSYLFNPDKNPQEKAQNYNIFIKSSGENYSQDDRFILSGGSGKGVLLKPVLNEENLGITSFEVVESGYDFVASDFLQKGEDLNLSTSSSISVTPSGAVAGQGLDAIIVGGAVVGSPAFTDEKPREIFSQELTPDVQKDGEVNTITDGPSDKYRAFGEDLAETDKSSNNQYDLFFHFHNDITHTWHNYINSMPPPFEQKLDLTINLDPDS